MPAVMLEFLFLELLPGKTKKVEFPCLYISHPSALLLNPPAPIPPPPPRIILAGYTLYMPFFLEFCFCLFFFCFFFTNQTMKSLLNYMIRVLFSFFLIFCDSSTSPVSFQEWSETRGCCHWGIESMGVLGSTCWHRAGFTHGGNVVRDKWTWWLENIVNNYLLCKSFRGFLKLLKLVFIN